MNEEVKTIPLSAVQLMADIQLVNVIGSTKMVAQCDLRRVRLYLEATDRLEGARNRLLTHITVFENLGVRHIWVDEAAEVINGVLKELRHEMESEEQRLVEKLDGLDRELEEHNKKKEERNKRRDDDGNIQDTSL